MSSLHIDRENQNSTFHVHSAHGAKMAARGVAVPSRVTQRKPLGEVNRVDARHQGSTKESLRVKASLANDRAAVVTKPHSQLAHKPKLQMRVNEQDKTKEEKTKQMKTEKDVRHQLTAEAKQLSSITDEDSDIEIMIPAPDETEDDFSNWFPASEVMLGSALKSWRPDISRPTQLSSPQISPPHFAHAGFDELRDDETHIWQLPQLPELPTTLHDDQDLKYFATLQ